ncbi:MAG TPA: hypothetical protein VFQ30_10705 [Ktedonobacteraceae bacterium]|nr:hypothetical protein [Ktedonobacteraceae bacterium]
MKNSFYSLNIQISIETLLPTRRFHGNRSPCHIGWVSLVTIMTERDERM